MDYGIYEKLLANLYDRRPLNESLLSKGPLWTILYISPRVHHPRSCSETSCDLQLHVSGARSAKFHKPWMGGLALQLRLPVKLEASAHCRGSRSEEGYLRHRTDHELIKLQQGEAIYKYLNIIEATEILCVHL